MKILLTGRTGQVGWELARSLMPVGEVVALNRSQCDLSRPETIPGIIQEIKPDVIVNAAAYTAVDRAEEEEVQATTINGNAVSVLAEQAKKRNTLLVHYSTDYVFDGNKTTPYTEDDVTNPLSAYGRSKLVGEEAIKQSGCEHLIFRTSWVYAARGSNFAKTMLRLAGERDKLKVVDDQLGSPTSAELIADVTALVLYQLQNVNVPAEPISGTYHLTAGDQTSWHGYAQFVIDLGMKAGMPLKAGKNDVLAISSSEFPSLAHRPLNSYLDTSKLRSTFKLTLPGWEHHAGRTLSEILSQMGFNG